MLLTSKFSGLSLLLIWSFTGIFVSNVFGAQEILTFDEMKNILGNTGCNEYCEQGPLCGRLGCGSLPEGSDCWTCEGENSLFFCMAGTTKVCTSDTVVGGCGHWVRGICRGQFGLITCKGIGQPTSTPCDRQDCSDYQP